MKTRLLNVGAAFFLVAAGILVQDLHAANSRDNLPKSKPAASAPKSEPQPRPEKSGVRTDDFKDRDNNGVDDRHEKKAIRPEPANAPTVKPEPKPKPAAEARKAPPQTAPEQGKPEEPPKLPPGR